MTFRAPIVALVLLASLVTPAAVFADDGPMLQAGPVVGLNRSILTSPADQPGDAQFMSGAAFNGFGVAVGGHVRAEIMPFLSAQADLLISWDRATGFEERGDLARDLSISTVRLRIPILIMAGWSTDTWRAEAGIGPEIAFAFNASGELEETNVPANEAFDLDVTSATSFGLTFGAGGAYRVTDDLWIPTAVRFSYFPTVGASSVSRFENYVSPTEPGALIVEYDWTFVWTVGVLFDIIE